MPEVPSHVKTFVAATAILVTAVLAMPAVDASAGASATLIRTAGKPTSGGPGDPVSYTYTWDYADCASNSPDPNAVRIVLAWDDSATTPIGFAAATVNQAKNECQGTVSGPVPANATAGDHRPSAYLENPNRGNTIVPNSNTGKAFPGQQFKVILLPKPTPVPTPTPTPTDTPLPSDTPTALTFSPAPTATSSSSNASPLTATNTGGSGPPAALLAGVGALLVIAAAVASAVLVRRRRALAKPDDPFQFLR